MATGDFVINMFYYYKIYQCRSVLELGILYSFERRHCALSNDITLNLNLDWQCLIEMVQWNATSIGFGDWHFR